MNRVIQALKSLGGSGTNEEITNKVVELANIPSEQLEVLRNPEKGGVTEIDGLGFTKSYLKQYGIIENSARGVWALTQKGLTTEKVDQKAVDRFVSEQRKKNKLVPLELPNDTLKESDTIDKISIPNNIWWVNQRDNFQEARDSGIIWAPLKTKSGGTKHFWDSLGEVRPGDTILHYAKGEVKSVSRAKSGPQETTTPRYLKNYDKSILGRSVELEYQDLTPPIPLSKIIDALQNTDINQGPFDKSGGVKQGYLFRLTPQALSLIVKASPDTNWPSFIESSPQPPNQPNSEDGNTEEERPHIPLNLILYGPPGTGKTRKLLKDYAPLFEKDNIEQWEMVTFHQSYGYEDFVEGLKPVAGTKETSGQVNYKIVPGIFNYMVTRAMKDHKKNFALFVDEINRANISKVFGELITLLEKDKRLMWDKERGRWTGKFRVRLPYTHTLEPDTDRFGVPNNLYVIGAMNTADRSIALLDTALRRRFEFEELMPDPDLLKDIRITGHDEIQMDRLLDAMNRRIAALYDREHQIGHGYFCDVKSWDRLKEVFLKQIIPLLQEYFFDDWEKIKLVLKDPEDDDDNPILMRIKTDKNKDFPRFQGDLNTLERVYSINKKITADQIIRIYKD
jgi:hypothetical protein